MKTSKSTKPQETPEEREIRLKRLDDDMRKNGIIEVYVPKGEKIKLIVKTK